LKHWIGSPEGNRLMRQQNPTLIGVFDDRREAEEAIGELERAGFSHEQIGFAVREVEAAPTAEDEVNWAERDMARGMATGGMLGGILAAAIAFFIPGMGPLLAGGILAAFFGGALAGTAIGGIVGAFQAIGVPEEHAVRYERHLHAGRAIVAVRAGQRLAEAEQILLRHGGHDLSPPAIPTEQAPSLNQPQQGAGHE
jgi:hypothetical protein